MNEQSYESADFSPDGQIDTSTAQQARSGSIMLPEQAGVATDDMIDFGPSAGPISQAPDDMLPFQERDLQPDLETGEWYKEELRYDGRN